MELLGFLLAVLAIAFVVAKLIFSRKAEKTPKRDAEWEAYMEGLRDDARARGVAFPEDAAKAPALTPQTSMLAAKSPKASEPPLVETTEFDTDWYFEQCKAGKTSGEILGMMFPQTLVDGKQSWEVLKDAPENKHDLDLMLACCKAEMESSQINLWFPAPAYFKRVAIILRKQKDYAREIGIIELYWQLCDRIYETKRKDGARAQLMAQHSRLKAGFQKRYDKAKLLLEKQRAKAQE